MTATSPAPVQYPVTTGRYVPGYVATDEGIFNDSLLVSGAATVGGTLTAGSVNAPINGVTFPSAPGIGQVPYAASSTSLAFGGALNVGPWVFDVRRFGAKGDGQVVTDGAISSSSNTNVLTCATSAPFKASDVGKAIMIKGAAAAGVTSLVTTITGFTSASVVTIGANAATTVASGGMVLWGSDDTAAFQAAINAANTFAQAHGTGIIGIPPASNLFYAIAGALVAGGATKCNGQLTIPLQPVTTASANAPTLWFMGSTDGGATRHWEQTVPQMGGSTLVSFGVFASAGAQTTALNANGQAACISAPTGANGYGLSGATPLFNNCTVVFSGMQILTTHSVNGLGYSALNLHGQAKAKLTDFGFGTTGTAAAGDFNTPITFANGLVVGVIMPASGNNDHNPMQNVTCHGGYTRAIYLTEHCDWQDGTILYCWSGICPVGNYGDGGSGSGAFHGANFTQVSVEGCTQIMEIIGPGAGGVGPQITGIIDNEGTPKFADSGFPSAGAGLNAAVGTVRVKGGGGTLSTTATTSIVIINDVQTLGLVASPPVLTINTAVQNPYGRYANVTLAGGVGITSVQLGAFMGGSSAPTMQTVFSQSAGVLAPLVVRVPPLGWIQVNGGTTVGTDIWFLE